MMPRNGRLTMVTPFGGVPMLACVVPDLFGLTDATSNAGEAVCARTSAVATSNAATTISDLMMTSLNLREAEPDSSFAIVVDVRHQRYGPLVSNVNNNRQDINARPSTNRTRDIAAG